MKDKQIPRHYRCADGRIACGTKTTHIDATSVHTGVTCQNCKRVMKSWGYKV